jgi:glycosyltransferase involved in cell wall biosynthesis
VASEARALLVAVRAAETKGEAMHVAFLNYEYDPKMASLEDLLQIYATLAGWINALHQEGAEVTVFQRFHQNEELLRHGIRFLLLSDSHDPRLRKWQIPGSLHRAIQDRCTVTSKKEPTVVHCNGLIFPLQLAALRAVLPARTAIVVQHHAEKPFRGLRRHIQKWCLRAVDGFFFAASELASSWVEHGLISRHQRVYEVMEGSTSFCRRDRAAARALTGMTGDPVVLWVGRLTSLKDPLAVLKGFEVVLQQLPNARLYMIFGSDELFLDVRRCIQASTLLSRSVTLLGRLAHSELESFYNSADYFVLGSHYEGSGYALAEALACGVVPVVTDIPSFRALTDGGKIGACWPPGDGAAFAAAFLRVSRQPIQNISDQAVHFFEKHLSFPAIARKAIRAYRELAAARAEQKR